MMAIASLVMYDWPEVAAANDALWTFVAGRLKSQGIEAPAWLDRTRRYDELWLSPDLLLAQTCGYPFATHLRGKVQLLGTPCYGAPGCDGANYCSVVIASRSSGIASLAEIVEATAAINSEHSQSGYWALRAAIAATPDGRPPSRAILTGGHRDSLRLVATGKADVAAIDAVAWALAGRFEPEALATVRVIASSPSATGLPVISALGTPDATVAALREALAAAIAAPALASARAALFLTGFEQLAESAYDGVLELKRLALTLPFPPLEV